MFNVSNSIVAYLSGIFFIKGNLMYKDHPVFEVPKDKTTKIWRYMDVLKYISLLQTSSLYFCRADFLKDVDPFEGSFPKKEYKYLIRTTSEEVAKNLYRFTSRDTYVNCWHLNEIESIAMWKLYSEADKGIAVQSTYEKFVHSLANTEEDIFAGQVQYIDYENDIYYATSEHKLNHGNAFTGFIHKRNIYEHEKEFRAIFHTKHEDEDVGKIIQVNLTNLIEKVVVSPAISNWIYDLIKNITENYYQGIDVVKSVFDSKPYY
jgi:hypothetical protein